MVSAPACGCEPVEAVPWSAVGVVTPGAACGSSCFSSATGFTPPVDVSPDGVFASSSFSSVAGFVTPVEASPAGADGATDGGTTSSCFSTGAGLPCSPATGVAGSWVSATGAS